VSGADKTGESFYFLEMNTRLQVEHPVTEEITGLDLVEQMIRVAAGEPLGFTQDDVQLNGWSVETRVYAEDPYRGFLPSTGRLVRYQPAKVAAGGDARTRVDDGVRQGGEISMFYDPMIAKLITWGSDPRAAIDAQVEALDGFDIGGISHNVDFLSALMQHPRFRSGEITTGFIAEEYPEGFTGAPLDEALTADLSALAAFIGTVHETRALQIDQQLGTPAPAAREHVVRLDGGAEHHVRFALDKVTVDGGEPLAFEADYAPVSG
jgi:propionyl-CoA carboxylase alpha chain